jgi:hypothetical protein
VSTTTTVMVGVVTRQHPDRVITLLHGVVERVPGAMSGVPQARRSREVVVTTSHPLLGPD